MHLAEIITDYVVYSIDAPDELVTVAFFEIRAPETPAGEDEIACKQDPRLGRVKTEVIVFVARCVKRSELVVTQQYALFIGNSIVNARLVDVVPPRLNTERVFHSGEITNMVWMRMSENDCIDSVNVCTYLSWSVKLVARIDDDSPLASHQKRIARESL
jgi:hypothetical protein